ncbi:hypothetical protein KQ945_15600 [Bacillus subtilis subsp. subtilis]|nr:hypothetical protein [Bacillus subtilis subsp. subtilis]
MPIDEIAGGVLGGLLRFIAWLFFELFIETFLQGTGYRILSWLRPKKAPSDTACTAVGLLFWVAVALIVFAVFRAILA